MSIAKRRVLVEFKVKSIMIILLMKCKGHKSYPYLSSLSTYKCTLTNIFTCSIKFSGTEICTKMPILNVYNSKGSLDLYKGQDLLEGLLKSSKRRRIVVNTLKNSNVKLDLLSLHSGIKLVKSVMIFLTRNLLSQIESP